MRVRTGRRLAATVLAGALLLGGCERPSEERLEWVTMGTVAAVQCPLAAVPSVRETVQAAFARVTAEFNAYDPQSAIRRLGACTPFGRPCEAFAARLKEETGGAFDPAWKRDGRLDYGAVAKGFAVDLAAAAVQALPSDSPGRGGRLLLDLGGNLKAVRGDWTVGVKDGPTFLLKEGEACATSATYYRGDHIRDARTGQAASSDVRSVTVIHPSSAMIADGLSTVLFILGREAGAAFVAARYPDVRVIW